MSNNWLKLFLKDALKLLIIGGVVVYVVGFLRGGIAICPSNEPFRSDCRNEAQSAANEWMLYAALPWVAALILLFFKRFGGR